MDTNNYIGRDERFSFRLADGWAEYGDGDDSTHAFWHESETSWTGNFRITAFHWPNETDSDKAGQYITEEIHDNSDAQRIKLGELDCAHYKKYSQQDDDGTLSYYWVTGAFNDIFICTFSIGKAQEALPVNLKELTTVQNMIKSIRLI
ncbi:MAG: DUF3805 domain-containing protein [Bacteroidota bacterium]